MYQQNNSSNGNNLPTPQQDDILAFIIAIKSGSVQKMKQLLSKYKGNISNRLQSQLRQPPLYFAVMNADEQLSYEMTKSLIQAGANPNFKDANEQTVMFYCFRDGKRTLIDYLMKLGCKIDEEDLYGQTPLYYAASQNRMNLVQLITSQMVNHSDKLAKQTPLFYSARKGHLDMCKALVELGCDVSHTDSNNKTAAEYAKKNKFQEVADYLLSETKKIKQINRNQSQNNIQQSSQNETNNLNNRKKKKDAQTLALNNNKNNYKISFLKQSGQIHDLTEQQVKQLYKTVPQLQTYLTNPEMIPQDLLQSTLIQSQTWQKIALKLINSCWKLKGAFWFYQPVDPVKFGIPDYFDKVSKPMDLGTVKKKLNYNVYTKAQQFVDDVKQVFKNCYLYNGQHHDISACAKQVQAAFDQGVKNQGLAKFINNNSN